MSPRDDSPARRRADEAADVDADEAPGVPLFRTWRGAYLFVFGCFIAMVLALTVFTHFYA